MLTQSVFVSNSRYSALFQYLEQEKHRLRQQLQLMEDEYEQRILELQSDIDTLKSKLSDSDISSRFHDREKSTLVAQLAEQNQRLTSELQSSAAREQELENRIKELREQVTDKRITVQVRLLKSLNRYDKFSYRE